MRGTRSWFHGATTCHSGGNLSMQVGVSSLCGRRGGSRNGCPPSWAALREILEARRLGYEFSGCNGGARSWAGSCRIASIIPFLIAMVATSARSWPMLRFRISASSLSCPMAELVRGNSVVRRVPLRSRVRNLKARTGVPLPGYRRMAWKVRRPDRTRPARAASVQQSRLRKLMPNLEHVTWREPTVTPKRFSNFFS